MAATTLGAGRLQVGEGLGDQFAQALPRHAFEVVMQQQGGVGRHQIDQRVAKAGAQALAGGQHPGHVAFVDVVEQAQDQAVDAGYFEFRDGRAHANLRASKASRMRRTAATDSALSPCTQSVWACKDNELPSLASSAWPLARLTA
ncbi:hypothetical protein D3C86_1630280 [compost metagenome]